MGHPQDKKEGHPTMHDSDLVIHEKDFVYPASCRPLPYIQSQSVVTMSVFAMLAISWWNLIVRVEATLRVGGFWSSFPGPLVWMLSGFDCAQLVFACVVGAVFMCPHRKRKHYFLAKETPEMALPIVVVLLPMCNEKLSVQQDTIRSILAMNYPEDKLRVIVLDDGGSDSLKSWCYSEFAESGVACYYLRREKIPGKPHFAKAGNLNFGMGFVKDAFDDVEFIAVFDADMMPVKGFLRSMLPHLLLDERVALVQCPQRYHNLPYGDPLAQDVPAIFDIIEPRKDTLGATGCCGSGFVVRRLAIESIGGFPTYGISEDLSTACYIMKKGWLCAYVHEDLQVGTQPDSLAGHIRQRTRWCIGGFQTAIEHGWFLRNCDGMTVTQRCLMLCFNGVNYIFILFITCFALFGAVLLFFRGPMLAFESRSDIANQARLSAVAFIANKVNQYVYGGQLGLLRLQREYQWVAFLGPFFAGALLRNFALPKWLGGHKKSFKSSGITGTNDLERNVEKRMRLWPRIKYLLFRQGLWPHALFVSILIAGLLQRVILICADPAYGTRLMAVVQKETGDSEAMPTFFETFIVYLGFPPLWFILPLQAYFSILWYAISPPANPPARTSTSILKQMQDGHGDKVYVPKHSIWTTILFELPGCFMVGYCAIVLMWAQQF